MYDIQAKKHNYVYLTFFITLITLLFNHSYAQGNTETQESEDYFDEYFLFKLISKDYVLSSDIAAYKLPDSLYISLKELCDAVYFPIDVSSDERTAKGTFLEKEFNLDLKSKEFFIDSYDYKDKINHLKIIDEDIFISVKLIKKIFKMRFIVDYNKMTLSMDSDANLPIYTEIEFKKRKQEFSEQNNVIYTSNKKIGNLDNPYGLLGNPTAQLRTSHSYTKQDAISTYSLFGKNDLLYFESDYGFAGDSNQYLSNIRLRFTDNQNFNSDYIKFLSFGDVAPPSIPLLDNVGDGRGVFISNKSQDTTQTADNYRLEGFAKVGTEIELYRNNFLLAITTADESGRYIFEGLNLDPGVNIFQIVKYSEFGKRTVETKRITLAGNVKKGELAYQAFIGQPNQRLFDGFIDKSRETQQSHAINFNFDYGLSDLSSIGFGVINQKINDREMVTATQSNIRFSALGGGYYNLGFANYNDGMQKSNIYIGYDLENVNISLFREDNFNAMINLPNDHTTLLTNSYYNFSNDVNLGGVFSFENLNFLERNYTQNSFQLGTHIGIHDFAFESELKWIEDSRRQGVDYLGQSRINFVHQKHTLRNFFNYRFDYLQNKSIIESNRILYRYFTETNNDIIFDYTHFFEADDWRFSNAVSFPLEYVIMGLGWTYNKQQEFTANLNLSIALQRHDDSYIPDIIPQQYAGRADAQLMAFYDKNNNNILDKTEESIPDVVFKSRGNISSKANKNGISILKGLYGNSKTIIQIDQPSLGDIYLKPVNDEYNFTPRVGSGGVIPVAIQVSGGIEGTIYNNTKKMKLILMDLKDKKNIHKTTIDDDGYFIFENIMQGDYQVILQNNHGKKLDTKKVKISRSEPFVYDIELHAPLSRSKIYTKPLDNLIDRQSSH